MARFDAELYLQEVAEETLFAWPSQSEWEGPAPAEVEAGVLSWSSVSWRGRAPEAVGEYRLARALRGDLPHAHGAHPDEVAAG